MFRALIVCFVLVLLLGPSPSGAFVVFQDPGDTGSNPGTPESLPTDGSPVDLNLWIQHGTLLSEPNVACSGTGPGDEFCGWDVRVVVDSVVAGDVTLVAFVPEPGTDVVFSLTSAELRGNGGNPLLGQVGAHRYGTLTVSATGSGTVEVLGNLFVTAALETGPVPNNVLALGDACASAGGDVDNDNICGNVDNCEFVANELQEDCCSPGSSSTSNPDGIGDACQCGDVTGDGAANSFDATMIKRQALGLSAPLFSVPDNCDVTGDGNCNSFDATMVTRKALGLSAPLFGNNCPNFTGSMQQ